VLDLDRRACGARLADLVRVDDLDLVVDRLHSPRPARPRPVAVSEALSLSPCRGAESRRASP
jgi:hypothetical protein